MGQVGWLAGVLPQSQRVPISKVQKTGQKWVSLTFNFPSCFFHFCTPLFSLRRVVSNFFGEVFVPGHFGEFPPSPLTRCLHQTQQLGSQIRDEISPHVEPLSATISKKTSFLSAYLCRYKITCSKHVVQSDLHEGSWYGIYRCGIISSEQSKLRGLQ